MRKPTQKELTAPLWAYSYACDVIKGRFELGEPIIATSLECAYMYAKYAIKRRFELGEPIIATSAYYAYCYAKDVVKRRFELGEQIIAKSSRWAYCYAKYVLKFSAKNKHNLIHIDFYEQCFRNNTIGIVDLPQKLRNHDDIQFIYFKAKVLT